VILEKDDSRTMGQAGIVAEKVDGLGVVGTLFLYGDTFKKLANFFMDEFVKMPRIGGRHWANPHDVAEPSAREVQRTIRTAQEKADGVLWTAANIRGFVLVKFGAAEVEGARRWLGHMIRTEGSIEWEFGSQALLCLR